MIKLMRFLFLFVSVQTFAIDNISKQSLSSNMEGNFLTINNSEEIPLEEQCSVTTSGTVEVGDSITIEMTITVVGPCDSRMAQKVRDRIAEIRADAKK